MERANVYGWIDIERENQTKKWGDKQLLEKGWWFALGVLTEEVGEVAKAILEHKPDEYREELVHAAAVIVAMLEASTVKRYRIKIVEPAPFGGTEKVSYSEEMTSEHQAGEWALKMAKTWPHKSFSIEPFEVPSQREGNRGTS